MFISDKDLKLIQLMEESGNGLEYFAKKTSYKRIDAALRRTMCSWPRNTWVELGAEASVRARELAAAVLSGGKAFESAPPEKDAKNLLPGGSLEFKTAGGVKFRCSRSLVNGVVRRYSSLGGGMTVKQVAVSVGLTESQVTAILKSCGVTHGSLPSIEHPDTINSDAFAVELAEQASSEKARSRIHEARLRLLEKDAIKWRRFEQTALEEIASLLDAQDQRPPTTEVVIRTVDWDDHEPFVVVATPTDFHHGKYASSFEVGGYSETAEEKAERLLRSASDMITRVSGFGPPSQFIVGIGSDYFHVDNDNGSTTMGTKQDLNCSPYEMLATGCDVMRKYIDVLRAVAPVRLVLMAGNHDKMLSMSLLLFLHAWYRDEDDVDVVMSGDARQYVLYGSTLMCFTHGDSAANRLHKLALLAATEVPELWGESRSRVSFTGHRHSELVQEDAGFVKYQLPSLSGPDRWHHRNGYVGNRKTLAGVVIGRDSGVMATVYSSDQ